MAARKIDTEDLEVHFALSDLKMLNPGNNWDKHRILAAANGEKWDPEAYNFKREDEEEALYNN
jgi:hypothetical protein